MKMRGKKFNLKASKFLILGSLNDNGKFQIGNADF